MLSPWRTRLVDLLLALGALAGGGLTITTQIHVDVPAEQAVTPARARDGWVAPDRELESAADPFVLQDGAGQAADNSTAICHLWDDVRACTGGEDLPCYTQQVGDCVANAVACAVNYLQFTQLARGPPIPGQFEARLAHRPYIYGVARTAPELGNKRLRGDGCVVTWACEAVQRYGVLSREAGPQYSGQLARLWGSQGVPEGYIWQAALFRVESMAAVTTWDQLTAAIVNGYPVPFGGQVGFRDYVVRDGRLWGVRGGSWNHSMCWTAIDNTAVSPFDGRCGAVYVQNSWGPNACPRSPDGAPAGGFWIDRTAAEYYLASGDCVALSNFDGFPAREPVGPDDFVLFDVPPVRVPGLTDAPLAVPVCEQYAGVAAEDATWAGSGVLGFTVPALLLRMRRRAKRRRPIRHFANVS